MFSEQINKNEYDLMKQLDCVAYSVNGSDQIIGTK